MQNVCILTNNFTLLRKQENQMKKVAVVGAGLAGLSFAKTLVQKNPHVQITLFDKARGVGGRMATRRIQVQAETLNFDHGAQYFTVTANSALANLVQQHGDVIKEWNGQVVAIDESNTVKSLSNPDLKRYVAVPSQSNLAKLLLQQIKQDAITLQLNTRISKVERHGKVWKLVSTSDQVFDSFDSLIINVPAEQAQALMQQSQLPATMLQPYSMHPCWAMMLALPKNAIPVPFDAAFVNNKASAFSWIANNSSKPDRTSNIADCWVAHASIEWSTKHVNDSQEQVQALLTKELLDLLHSHATTSAQQEPLAVHVHRWLYSIPAATSNTTDDAGYIWDDDMQLGFVGDWCNKGKVEGAFLSGYNLAFKM